MTHKKANSVNRFIIVFERLEDLILSGLLLLMISMAVLQIFLRNFFDSGILWGDALVRTLVLWIGLIGAMIASRSNNHISIDILSRYLPKGIKKAVSIITCLFTSAICACMAWFSFSFVLMEKQDNMKAFAGVPAWVCESIIPIAFAIIFLRYLALTITSIFSRDREPE